ncbi:hypothetical protein TWF696_008813 [Orbilia brochopaga]|uniref:DUF833-domain-containing protein n=1 Tax=Orbilia brochopaga TaxID=3140254 RepID=A0AAV9UK51_9PEZI
MCIVLWTTACADQGFPLILLSNRDEFLRRPTQPAGPWKSSDDGVYGGRDLARPENGTWLGITRSGRFAALTNVREANSVAAVSTLSRGAVVSSFLASPEADFESSWMDRLETDHEHIHAEADLDLDQVGGFSMLCGHFVRTPERKVRVGTLGIISNRARAGQKHANTVDNLNPALGESHGLSNSTFAEPWPKVVTGKELLDALVKRVHDGSLNEQGVIDNAFEILSHDSLTALTAGQPPESKIGLLKMSVFIPIFDTGTQLQLNNQPNAVWGGCSPAPEPSLYGTQKQSVIIVHESGQVRFIEKTKFDWLQGQVPAEDNTVDIVFNLDI